MMKKGKWFCLLVAMMLFIVACFCGCSDRDEALTEPTTNVPTEAPAETQIPTKTIGYQIPDYTEDEIQAAMDTAKLKFAGFEGCELLRLEYIEGKYLSDYEDFAKRYGVEKVIVLESDFYAGPDAPPSFNQEHTYDNWKWIMIDDGNGWVVCSSGYA